VGRLAVEREKAWVADGDRKRAVERIAEEPDLQEDAER
jgi:hypothetical protein